MEVAEQGGRSELGVCLRSMWWSTQHQTDTVRVKTGEATILLEERQRTKDADTHITHTVVKTRHVDQDLDSKVQILRT